MQASEHANVDIFEEAMTVTYSDQRALLVLPFVHSQSVQNDLYFWSDKSKDTRVNHINVLSNVLGSDIPKQFLFAHAFTVCGTTSRIFGMGYKPMIEKVVRETQYSWKLRSRVM